MITFPNAKINLGLSIIGKRENGYHEIETCLYPIDLFDVLEIVRADQFSFNQTGLNVEGGKESNLVVRAYDLLNTYHNLSPVAIHLHKLIPMGAGLGGGSSDAAYTIKMLNELFNLQLEPNQLRILASQLGSDCPFFVDSRPAIATGTGTTLHTIDLDLSEYRIELRHSDVHVSTADAYGLVAIEKASNSIDHVLNSPVSSWQDLMKNDFEEPIGTLHPEILKIKKDLLQKGAVYASMTGSGSSVFGLFRK